MKKTFRLAGLDCANCANKMEKKILTLDGVNEIAINFMTTKMIVEYDEAKETAVMENIANIIHSIDSNVEIKRG